MRSFKISKKLGFACAAIAVLAVSAGSVWAIKSHAAPAYYVDTSTDMFTTQAVSS